MGTIGNTFVTFRDLASGLKGDKTFDHDIVDLAVEVNEILDDIPVVEANDGSSNRTTIRTGIAGATWAAFYQGIQASKGSKQQIVNVAGSLASKLEIDKRLFDRDPNKAAFLADEVKGHMEGMGNEVADALFYGNLKTEARKFNGLAYFYNTIGSTGSDDKVASHYVFDGKKAANPSSAAYRSIWLLNWGNSTMRCFYPQGSKGGISKGTFDTVDVTDSSGGTYQAYRQYFYWDIGLDVRDFRYGGRIANIESDVMLASTGQPSYLELVDQLEGRVKGGGGTRRVFYMPKGVWESLKILYGRATRGNAIAYADVEQRKTPTLFGVPVRLCDALNTNETVVS